ncbi:hypothetical protein Pla108_09630 [Botrimarina colliarenosi]|uniref:DUF1963 domain-containing protein n=1 Tax=Botrimarina colliarenosi TaxID=2528001 RepID=A0A5C6AK40_9BACT|nr:YwqG family protein [Botrimarina colliarenosi]TWU00020.1 hypothetical protein Pla108_09630 [Botrimarina colliarenosi]
MTEEALASRIEALGLGPFREEIIESAEACLSVTTSRDESRPCEIGSSKIGGDPDLPADLEWPRASENSLHFIAQFKLSELPPIASTSLPSVGMLYFFYDMNGQHWGFDPEDGEGHRVLYSECETGLSRRLPPDDIANDDAVLECHLQVAKSFSLPSDPPSGVSFEGDQAQWDAYFELTEGSHQLLGLPSEIQNPMELECQLASNGLYVGDASGYQDIRAKALEEGATDWRLLFQMDSDDDAGIMWGDGGMIYYWIRKQDLAAKRFEKSWLILQCY